MSTDGPKIRFGVVWLYVATIATLSILFLYFPDIMQFSLRHLIGLLS